MGFRGFYIALCIGLTSVAGVACGGGDGNPDAQPVSLFDASPPDASIPDAFVCVETATRKACGTGMAGCVDITRENLHCGGCDMACASAGMSCVAGSDPEGDAGAGNGVAYCECPPVDFVPESITPLNLSQLGVEPVNANPQTTGEYIGVGPYLDGSLVHAVVATFDLNDGANQVGVDLDLSAVASDATAPRVVAGYNIDLQSQNIQTPYGAISGTLRIHWACPTGVSATVTDATFVEVAGVTDPTPVNGGCGFTLPTTTFVLGTCADSDGGMGADANPAP